MTLDEISHGYLLFVATLFGLVSGDFLNVLIYRVPRKMSVWHPRSHCPACKSPIPLWNILPVIGYLRLRGRCRDCGVRVPPRYPLVEALGGLVGLLVMEVLVRLLSPSTGVGVLMASFFGATWVVLVLVALAFVWWDRSRESSAYPTKD